MNILIIYSTNSGSTEAAAHVVSSTLIEKSHTTTLKPTYEATPADLANYDLVIFGSPSWDYDGKEGQPLEDMTKFLAQLNATSLTGKKYAIFGLGDTSYMHFCGAVEIMEAALTGKGMAKVVESLKIDRYYSRPGTSEKVKTWAQGLNFF